MKKTIIFGSSVVALSIVGMAYGFNYFTASRPLQQVIELDSRNHGVEASAHFQYYLLPSSLVFDLKGVGPTNSMADVTRVLLQYSAAMKEHTYHDITLAYSGKSKFMLDGAYFHELGSEFGAQNPIYTIRTLPQNVKKLDGSAAFGRWEGGWLGVMGKQMEDFNEFHKQWYIADMSKAAS
ncbi:hypothetical protein BG58_39455 [Caballeronia jiangsuensis]|nr:hypothetical protein BG58_39455 [Caballeronia jiangsuensis]